MSAGPGHGERGAALLTVLLLVAVVGLLASAAMERLRLSTSLAANIVALDQARAFAIGTESLVTLSLDDFNDSDASSSPPADLPFASRRQLPLPGGGKASAMLRDGGNCFNINSVGEGSIAEGLVPRPAGIAQFAALMRVLGIAAATADGISRAAADWVDSDSEPAAGGAEDQIYARAEQGYRTGNTLFAEVSELRAVAGMTPESYTQLRPWLCALPVAELSGININTLTVEQAPLLAMLDPAQISVETAARALAMRPAAGWESLWDFYSVPPLAGVVLPLDVHAQPLLRPEWFALDLRVTVPGAELTETALIDARAVPAKIVVRRWGVED